MKLKIFHTLNCALLLDTGSARVWVDGLHGGNTVGMSLIPEDLQADFHARRNLYGRVDGYVFTHAHGDHFEEALVRKVSTDDPAPAIYCPGAALTNLTPERGQNGGMIFSVGDISFQAVPTTHDCAQFEQDPHVSYLVEACGQRIFIAGDAALYPEEVLHAEGTVDMAFVNLYQATGPYIKPFFERLRPFRIFLYHLPRQEDDDYSYWRLAKQAVKRWDGTPQIEVLPHMSYIL